MPTLQALKESQDSLPKNILICVVLSNYTNLHNVQKWKLARLIPDDKPPQRVGPIK